MGSCMYECDVVDGDWWLGVCVEGDRGAVAPLYRTKRLPTS